ncbi:hypothetical protein ACFFRR_011069 [Megaselia abdita]
MSRLKIFLIILTFTSVFAKKDVIFQCDEAMIYDENKNFCTISNFVAESDQTVHIVHNSNKNNVKYMKCYDSKARYIPYKLFENFPNLQSLDISNSYIEDISRNSFHSADNLLYLNMSLNRIKSLGPSAFKGAAKTLKIELAANEISEISPNAFNTLDDMDKLVLSRNLIRELDKSVFVENVNLNHIHLDNNLIEEINPDLFSYCKHLRIVDLSNNRLKKLQPNTFELNFVLEGLFLSGNLLETFNLTNLYSLNKLNLDNNRLTSLVLIAVKNVRANNNEIENITVRNFENFETMNLAHNHISNLTNITKLSNLVSLDLSSNKVGPVIGLSTFSNLRNLRELRLRNTSLSSITFGMFSKQTKLTTFDISFNGLRELNLDMLAPYMTTVKQFFIDGNSLTEIKGRTTFFQAFPYLYSIGLSKNKFNCTYLHHIITTPFLSPNVELYIEPIDSDIEKTHIRDITCEHEDQKDDYDDEILIPKKPMKVKMTKEKELSSQEREMFIAKIQGQQELLSSHLLWMKITLITIAVALICFVVFKSMDYKRRLWRSVPHQNHVGDSSIVFRSTTTVNTTGEA